MMRFAAFCVLLFAAPVAAQDLTLPTGARQISDRTSPLDSYLLPTGPAVDGIVPSRNVEGRVERFTWRVQSGSSTTLQLLAPLRAQLTEQGYDILFECKDKTCGGFDFRFGTEVVPTPDMYVAIQDYRFLSATRDQEVLSLLVSRTPPDGYIQMIRVSPVDAPQPAPVVVEKPVTDEPDLLTTLTQTGHVVLDDLHFHSGEVVLGDGNFKSLTLLAEYLTDNPDARLALVGHTDDTGDLAVNTSVSAKRAEMVKTRLIEAHGVAASRLEAQGVGYLSPITSNATPEGREVNRRVEAVLLLN